ncbi:MAG: DNA-deoxyinosine glycosylase [Clostridiales bacterium]|jgi:hypoxanthine-DNA glycosylase|nr:DNA-deoxyinosine glycosylase [Clostridiales bacterium]
MTKQTRHIIHPFAPVVGTQCKVLILGSIPSVKSVEDGYPYAHPHNKFWRLMSDILGIDFALLNGNQRQQTLLAHDIALFDAILECDIVGSSDSTATNIIHTDILTLIAHTNISKILCNGTLSYRTVTRYNPNLSITVVRMPSTSPANATMTYQTLLSIWSNQLQDLIVK